MGPSERFLKIFKAARLCAAICGADIYNKNFKINIVTYVVIFCITVYFIFSVYTVQLKFAENWTILLESFCMVGSVFQGISKLVSFLLYRRINYAQSQFLLSVYKEYENRGSSYETVLNKTMTRVKTLLQVVSSLYLLVFLSLILTPLFMYLYTGRRLFVMQFYLPLVDSNTDAGYFATLGMQCTCFTFGAFGNFAADVFMLIFFTHSTMLVDLFEVKANELNEVAEDFGNPKVESKLKAVIEWHQIFANYVQIHNEVFYWINFTQITTSGMNIVLTLVIMLTGDWPGAYSYTVISFAMLYLYCGMGTLVEISNERVVDIIYDIHWYYLTVPQQKAIRFMLMKAQSSKSITVGGVVPLSVSTGLQVTKSVYSVFMMLLNFLN